MCVSYHFHDVKLPVNPKFISVVTSTIENIVLNKKQFTNNSIIIANLYYRIMTSTIKRMIAVGGGLAAVIAIAIVLALMQHNQIH
jgi:hypothetical protein